MASLSEMMLNRYLSVQKQYSGFDEEIIIEKVNNVLDKEINVDVKTKLNTDSLLRISNYYNFASYTIMVAIILLLSLIMANYNKLNIISLWIRKYIRVFEALTKGGFYGKI